MIPLVSNNIITILLVVVGEFLFPYTIHVRNSVPDMCSSEVNVLVKLYTIETYYGKTLLETAVEKRHSDIVHYLIVEKGCIPKHYKRTSPGVLMLACEHGQLDLVEKLIEDHHWDITGSYCK